MIASDGMMAQFDDRVECRGQYAGIVLHNQYFGTRNVLFGPFRHIHVGGGSFPSVFRSVPGKVEENFSAFARMSQDLDVATRLHDEPENLGKAKACALANSFVREKGLAK